MARRNGTWRFSGAEPRDALWSLVRGHLGCCRTTSAANDIADDSIGAPQRHPAIYFRGRHWLDCHCGHHQHHRALYRARHDAVIEHDNGESDGTGRNCLGHGDADESESAGDGLSDHGTRSITAPRSNSHRRKQPPGARPTGPSRQPAFIPRPLHCLLPDSTPSR